MSTKVASVTGGTAGPEEFDGDWSGGKWGMTWVCVFLMVSMLIFADAFFCLVCSDVFDRRSLSALRAICLKERNIQIV